MQKKLAIILIVSFLISFLNEAGIKRVAASSDDWKKSDYFNISHLELKNDNMASVSDNNQGIFWIGDIVFFNIVVVSESIYQYEFELWNKSSNKMVEEVVMPVNKKDYCSLRIATSSLDPGQYSITFKEQDRNGNRVVVKYGGVANIGLEERFTLYEQPSDTSVNEGEEAIFSVSVNDYDDTNLYQWYYTPDATGTTGTKINGATSSTYIVEDVDDSISGRYYFCKITVKLLNNNEVYVYSRHAKLEVETDAVPIISSVYYQDYAYEGDSTVFAVTVSGVDEDDCEYQWYYSNTETGRKILINDAVSSQYSITLNNETSEKWYVCTVTNGKMSTDSIRMHCDIKYKIAYNANGGNDAPDYQTKNKNETLQISYEKPYRNGYEFLGWSTYSSETGVEYSGGDIYTDNKSIVLYAVWNKKETNTSMPAISTVAPTATPTLRPTATPTATPTLRPTATPTLRPTATPTLRPTATPTLRPTATPTLRPTPTPEISDDDDYINDRDDPEIETKSSIKKNYGAKKFRLNVSTYSDGKMTFKSSNKKIVSVNNSGIVKIHGCGSAVITIKTARTTYYKSGVELVKVCIIPDKIEKFKVKSISKGKVIFTWKKKHVEKSAKCQIQADTASDFNNVKSVPDAPFTKGKYVADGLTSGKTYYFRIRVVVKKSGRVYSSSWTKKKLKVE